MGCEQLEPQVNASPRAALTSRSHCTNVQHSRLGSVQGLPLSVLRLNDCKRERHRAGDREDSRQGLYFCPADHFTKLVLTPPAIVCAEQLPSSTSDAENITGNERKILIPRASLLVGEPHNKRTGKQAA